MNDLSHEGRESWTRSILAIDGLALRNHELKRRRRHRALLISVMKTGVLVFVVGTVWQLFATTVPMPSVGLGSDASEWLPLVPVAIGLWLNFRANDRSEEVDDAERDLIAAELDSLKQGFGNH